MDNMRRTMIHHLATQWTGRFVAEKSFKPVTTWFLVLPLRDLSRRYVPHAALEKCTTLSSRWMLLPVPQTQLHTFSALVQSNPLCQLVPPRCRKLRVVDHKGVIKTKLAYEPMIIALELDLLSLEEAKLVHLVPFPPGLRSLELQVLGHETNGK
ncbi:hypothetical protein GGF32_008026 [Allomyces javanicus]|nr:hypothetical protein GGF32_008026 [Allomyces javanicus]